jgi:hypothetical protein
MQPSRKILKFMVPMTREEKIICLGFIFQNSIDPKFAEKFEKCGKTLKRLCHSLPP